MRRFWILIILTFIVFLTAPVKAYCQDIPCVEVCDTLDNFVVTRNNNGKDVLIYKVDRFQTKKQIISSYDCKEEINKTAMTQCGINYSQVKIEKLIRNSLTTFPNKNAAGRVFLSIILSKTLNIEYFELHGHGLSNLSNEDLLIIYKAISQSDLFSIWDCNTPYVSFVATFVI